MAKVKFEDIRKNDWAEHIFIHLLSEKYTDDELSQIIKDTKKKGEGYDVELKINGEEMDFMVFAQHVQKQDEERIKKKALDYISENFGDLSCAIYEIQEKIEKELREKLTLD